MSKRYFSGFPDARDKGDAAKGGVVSSHEDGIATVYTSVPKSPEMHFETQEIEKAPEIPDIPDVEFLVLTSREIKSKTDDDLVAILSGESYPDKCLYSSTISLINTELISRTVNKSSKPSWITFLMLATGVFATVFSGIGAWPVIQQLLSRTAQSEPLNYHEGNSQQLNALPEIAPQPQAMQLPSSSTVSQKQDLSESLKTHKQSIPEEEQKKQE